MVGWWTGFPFWLSVAVIALGGILGVMYSVPLRRALVTGSDLPYPEGVAAAEVLKVGAGRRRRRGEPARPQDDRLQLDRLGRLRASSPRPSSSSPRRRAASASAPARRPSSTSLSMALIGVGHLVGLAVGIAMLVGLIISWFVLVPWQTGLAGLALGGGHRDAGRRHDLPRKGPLHRRRRRSASRRSGPCSRSSARSSRASPRRLPPAARARRAAQDSLATDRARHSDRHRRRDHRSAR